MSPLSASTLAALLAISNLSAPRAFASASPAATPPVRMQSTDRAESAPLNILSRAFRSLEPYFDDAVQSQRLTYRIHRAPGSTEPIDTSLRRLMINIGGGLVPDREGAQVRELSSAADEAFARGLLAQFAAIVTQVISSRGRAPELSAIPLEKFRTSMNALTARPDVKVFTANLLDEGFESRVLILMDEETNELLLLYVTRPPNEI